MSTWPTTSILHSHWRWIYNFNLTCIAHNMYSLGNVITSPFRTAYCMRSFPLFRSLEGCGLTTYRTQRVHNHICGYFLKIDHVFTVTIKDWANFLSSSAIWFWCFLTNQNGCSELVVKCSEGNRRVFTTGVLRVSCIRKGVQCMLIDRIVIKW